MDQSTLSLPWKLKHDHREAWLNQAALIMRDLFPSLRDDMPKHVRISVGFPGGSRGSSSRKTIGQAWHPRASQDGIPQVFISPVLDDYETVLATLLHELIHTCYPDAGHKGPFKRAAIACGLEGKMTATVPSESLKPLLRDVHHECGPYPHGRLNLSDRKKQSTRLVKCECSDCGYIARTTSKWIEELGAPICPCNNQPMGVSQ